MLSSLNTLAGCSILFPKKTPVPSPNNLSISNITETTITIQFDAVSIADNYIITTSPVTSTITTTNTTYTLTGLTIGVTYTIYVRAQNIEEESLSSPASVSGTTGVKTIMNVNASASFDAGSNTVFVFNGSSGFLNFGNIISSNGITMRLLAVGGGGGGGAGFDGGGGGGGGGGVVDTSFNIQGNNWLEIVTGAGGVGGTGESILGTSNPRGPNSVGTGGMVGGNTLVNFNTVIGSNVVALGGGGGGEYSFSGTAGGSGGGAGSGNAVVVNGTTSLNNIAFAGGKYVSGGGSAGGGGAGQVGADASGGLGGAGGVGYQTDITGTTIYWGGGGGGVSIAGNGSVDTTTVIGPIYTVISSNALYSSSVYAPSVNKIYSFPQSTGNILIMDVSSGTYSSIRPPNPVVAITDASFLETTSLGRTLGSASYMSQLDISNAVVIGPWVARTSAAMALRDIAWSPTLSQFAAVAYSGGSSERILTSTNGFTWSAQSVVAATNYDWYGITWAPSPQSRYVTVATNGRAGTSTNGTSWTSVDVSGANWTRVVWAPSLSLYCAVSIEPPNPTFKYTFDISSGNNFANLASGVPVYDASGFNGATINTTDFKVGIGSLSLVKASSQYVQLPSFTNTTNGITISFWFKHNTTEQYARIFDFGNGPINNNIAYCPIEGAIIYDTALRFTGGPSFIKNTTPNVWHFFAWTIPYVASGNTTHTFYFDGSTATSSAIYPPVVTRTINYIGESNWTQDPFIDALVDDFRWYDRVLSAAEIDQLYQLKPVMTSTNATTWTRQTAPMNNWRAISWSPSLSRFVAVADTGMLTDRVMTSSNGINWSTTPLTTGMNLAWKAVTWSPALGIYAAVASSGTGSRVMTSVDGSGWVLRTTPADIEWSSITWASELGLFVAVAASGSGNRCMTSHNGINWRIRATPDINMQAVAWSPTLEFFVAVGDSGTNRVASLGADQATIVPYTSVSPTATIDARIFAIRDASDTRFALVEFNLSNGILYAYHKESKFTNSVITMDSATINTTYTTATAADTVGSYSVINMRYNMFMNYYIGATYALNGKIYALSYKPLVQSTISQVSMSTINSNIYAFVDSVNPFRSGVYDISASSQTEPAWKLFDNNVSTFWHAEWSGGPVYTQQPYNPAYIGGGTGKFWTTVIQGVGTISGEWVQIKLPYYLKMTGFVIGQRGGFFTDCAPGNFYVVGSTDGINWTNIIRRTSQTYTSGFATVSVSTSNYYNYFRMVIDRIVNTTNTVIFTTWDISGIATGVFPATLDIINTRANDAITTIPDISGGFVDAWENGVVAPNGNIYFTPRDSNAVLIVNTNTDIVNTTTITGLTGAGAWHGGVLGSSGKIYCAPRNSSHVLTIDPSTNTANQTAIAVQTGTNKWSNGVAGPNGRVYFFPRTSGTILAINTYSDSVDASFAFPNMAVSSGVVAPNGKIYCAPSTGMTAYVIEPTTNTTSTISAPSFALPVTSNIQLWFDANDYSTLVLGGTGGNELTQWNDKSGFGRHATPYQTGTTKNTYGPTLYNGRPGIQFVYNQGFSAPLPSGTLSTGATYFVVFQKNGGTTEYEALFSRTNGYQPAGLDIYNGERWFSGEQKRGSSFNIRNATGLNIFSATFTSTSGSTGNYSEWVNGSSTAFITNIVHADNTTRFCIGTRDDRFTNFNGVFAEILVYNRTLSSSERQSVESYLAGKWHISAVYPSTTIADNGLIYSLPAIGVQTIQITPSLPIITAGAPGGIGGGGGGAVINYFGSSISGGSGGGMVYSVGGAVGGNSVVVPIVGGGHAAAGTGGGGGGSSYKNSIALQSRAVSMIPTATVRGNVIFTHECPRYDTSYPSLPFNTYMQKSMYFDGTTYVSLGTASDYAYSNATYECLFKAPSNSTGLRALITKPGVFGMYLDASGRLNAGYTNGTARSLLLVDSYANDNAWHHAALTITQDVSFVLYLDGVPRVTRAVQSLNYSLQFNRTTSPYADGGASYEYTTVGTVEAWLQNVGTVGSNAYQIVIGVQNRYGIFLYNNVLIAYDWLAGTNITTSITINDGGWHHVALVFQFGVTNGSKLYYDGLPVLTFTYSGYSGTATNLFIGGGVANRYLSGRIDEARVWNVAKTDAEIFANYNTPLLPVNSVGLTGYWLMNEGSGATSINLVSGGPSLTLINSPSWQEGRTVSFFPIQRISPIQIGADNSANLFIGSIANVRVWNSVRSAADISANRFRILRVCDMSSSMGPSLVASFPLNDLSSTIVNYAPRVGGYGGSGAVVVSVPKVNVFTKHNYGLTFHASTGAIACSTDATDFALYTGTVGCWIKTTNAGAGLRALVAKPNAYGIYTNDSVIGVYNWSTSAFVSATVNVADGLWHHIRFVFNDRIVNGSSLYVDQVLRATFTYTILNQSGVLGIRNNPASLTEGFLGQIYNVRLWNYMKTDMVATSALNLSPEMGLIGSWPLNEGIPATVYNYAAPVASTAVLPASSDFSWNAIGVSEFAPSQLVILDFTESTATLQFRMNGYAVSYNVTTKPASSTWSITNNMFQLTGLTGGINYTVYVRGVDKYGQESTAASAAFTTLRNTTYYYKFDAGDFSNNLGVINYKSGAQGVSVYDASLVTFSQSTRVTNVSPIQGINANNFTATAYVSPNDYQNGVYDVSASSSSLGAGNAYFAFDSSLATWWSSDYYGNNGYSVGYTQNPYDSAGNYVGGGAGAFYTTVTQNAGTISGEYIQVKTPYLSKLTQFRIQRQTLYTQPRSISVLGSNDQSTWTFLSTQSIPLPDAQLNGSAFSPTTTISTTADIAGIAVSSDNKKLLIVKANTVPQSATFNNLTNAWSAFTNTGFASRNWYCCTMTANGQRAIAGVYGGLIYHCTWDDSTGTYINETVSEDTTTQNYTDMDVTADGSRLVIGIENSRIYFASWDSGNNRYGLINLTLDTNALTGGYNNRPGVGISSDGSTIVYGTTSPNTRISVWNGTNYAAPTTTTSYGGTRYRFLPDNKTILVMRQTSYNVSSAIYFVWTGSFSSLTNISNLPTNGQSFHVPRNGRSVYTCGGNVSVNPINYLNAAPSIFSDINVEYYNSYRFVVTQAYPYQTPQIASFDMSSNVVLAAINTIVNNVPTENTLSPIQGIYANNALVSNAYILPNKFQNGLYDISASSSSVGSQNIYFAVDSSLGTLWRTNYYGFGGYTRNPYDGCGNYVGGGSTPQFYTTVTQNAGTISGEYIQLKTPYASKITKYRIQTSSIYNTPTVYNTPREISLVGSNDGITWDLIDRQTTDSLLPAQATIVIPSTNAIVTISSIPLGAGLSSTCMSADNTRLFGGHWSDINYSAVFDRQTQIWTVTQYPSDLGNIVACDMTADGSRLFYYTNTTTTMTWSDASGRFVNPVGLRVTPGSGELFCLKVTPDGTKIVIGHSNNYMYWASFNPATVTVSEYTRIIHPVFTGGNPTGFPYASFSDDGEVLVFGTPTQGLFYSIWDGTTYTVIANVAYSSQLGRILPDKKTILLSNGYTVFNGTSFSAVVGYGFSISGRGCYGSRDGSIIINSGGYASMWRISIPNTVTVTVPNQTSYYTHYRFIVNRTYEGRSVITLNSLDISGVIFEPTYSGSYQVGNGSLNLIKNSNAYLLLPSFATTLGGFSTAFWVRANSDSSNACIFDFGNADASNVISARFSSGIPQLYMQQQGITRTYTIGTSAITNDTWNHIAWSIKPSTGVWSAYLNGIPYTTAVSAYPAVTTRTANFIGKYITDTSNINLQPFLLDDFRTFNSALDDTQVANLYYGRSYIPGFAPFNLTILNITVNPSITIAFTPNAAAVSYEIRTSPATQVWTTTDASFTLTGLSNSTTYVIYVYGIGAAGERSSPASIAVTTFNPPVYYYKFDTGDYNSGTSLLANYKTGSQLFDASYSSTDLLTSPITTSNPAVGTGALSLARSTKSNVILPQFTTSTSGMSLSVWFKSSTDASNAAVFDASSASNIVSVRLIAGRPLLYLQESGTQFSAAIPRTFVDGSWNHLIWNIDASGYWTTKVNGLDYNLQIPSATATLINATSATITYSALPNATLYQVRTVPQTETWTSAGLSQIITGLDATTSYKVLVSALIGTIQKSHPVETNIR